MNLLPIGTKVVFNSKDDTRKEKSGKVFLITRYNRGVSNYPYILGQTIGEYDYYDFGASTKEVVPATKLDAILS